MYSLQGEYDRYITMYGGSVGYGGAQAGTGTGGVDGVGVITVHKDGSVTSENGVVTTQTLPDGTKVTTVVAEGERFQKIEYTDGTTKITEEWPTSTDDNGNIRIGGSRVELTAINDTKTTTLTRDDGSKYHSVIDKDGHGTSWDTLPNGTEIKIVVTQIGYVETLLLTLMVLILKNTGMIKIQKYIPDHHQTIILSISLLMMIKSLKTLFMIMEG